MFHFTLTIKEVVRNLQRLIASARAVYKSILILHESRFSHAK